jgi:hypothetical protein
MAIRKNTVAARHLLSAIEALAWYIENTPEDHPNRNRRFFAARGVWRDAYKVADAAGIVADIKEPWKLITADDAPGLAVYVIEYRDADHRTSADGVYATREVALQSARALAEESLKDDDTGVLFLYDGLSESGAPFVSLRASDHDHEVWTIHETPLVMQSNS